MPVIAGVDESGRGPLAGPVVAAAVIVPAGVKKHPQITDSKKLSLAQREELYEYIIKNYFFGVGIVDHRKIDEVNILQASFLAMAEAVANLKERPTLCLIDGNKTIPQLKIKQQAVIKGDSKVHEISAASIVAKVTRDRLMLEYDKKYPEYGFAKHKGYGTRQHLEALLKYGRSPIHRRSFTYFGEKEYTNFLFQHR